MADAIPVGTILFGRFRVEGLIAEGGQGYVWKALDQSSGQSVAIKQLTSDVPELQRRFEREMELRLDHPAIVQCFQSGIQLDRYFMVMEFLEGEDLSSRLAVSGAMPPDAVVSILRQAASGLAYAHQNNVIHRDIKPENLFLVADGRLKITDFGIACFLDRERMTRTGSTLGTAHYMSPEQVEDVSKVDRATDIWSLGVVAYELLTGKKPFEAPLLGELYVKIVSHDPSPPSHWVPALDPQVDSLIMSMLVKDPARRPARMDDVVAALPQPPTDSRVQPAPGPGAPIKRPKERTGVSCPRCQTVNRAGSVACSACGQDLRRACAHCAGPVAVGARFCGRCGHPVSAARQRGLLIGLKGAYASQRLPLERDFMTFGRSASLDVRFDEGKDDFVSRFQARVFRERGSLWIEGWDWVHDAPTTNGTFVNGQNIDGKGKVPLRNGDRLRLGDSFFRFEIMDGAAVSSGGP